MDLYQKLRISGLLLFGLLLVDQPSIQAARAINPQHQNILFLQSFSSQAIAMKETSREVDSRHALYVRLQELI